MSHYITFIVLICHSVLLGVLELSLNTNCGTIRAIHSLKTENFQNLTVKGRILSNNGETLKMAHVRSVIADDWNYTEILTKTKKDGSFEITLSKDKNVYQLFFTGVHHKPRHVSIFSDLGDCVLEIRLEPVSIGVHSEIKGLLSNVHDFYPLNRIEYEKANNGKYIFSEKELPDGTTHFQVSGVYNGDNMRIAGPEGPFRSTENIIGSDGYASTILAERKPIIINLKKFTHRNGEGKVKFLSENGIYQETAFEAYCRINEFINSMMTKLYEQRDRGDFSKINLQPEFDRIEKMLNESEDEQLSKILLLEYLGFDAIRSIVKSKDPERHNEIFDGKAKSEILVKVIEHVPPLTSLWHIESRGLFWLVKELPLNHFSLSYFEKIYNQHPDESIRAIVLYGLAHKYNTLKHEDEFLNAFGQLASKYPKHPYTFRAKAEFGLSSELNVGQPVPDFKIYLLDEPQNVLTPQMMLGRVYLIDFWATWCGGCILKMPGLSEVYDKYSKKGFEILSISLDNRVEAVNNFRQKRYSLPWLNAIELNGFKSDIARRFEVSSIPKSILVEPNGNILAIGDASELDLDSILKNFYKPKN
ncbi:MAG TPA: TlpA disulfide reductase family protein [Saprospiraceae bacterium]|nr:TlpA disulfide reductase family protein [Saprospiraceae bacterium]